LMNKFSGRLSSHVPVIKKAFPKKATYDTLIARYSKIFDFSKISIKNNNWISNDKGKF
jgi:hypothetical protein